MKDKVTTQKNSFLNEAIVYAQHRSGLKIYLMKKDFTSSFVIFGTRYGSFDNVFELEGETVSVPNGIAHFLEHKMFETEDGRDTFELFSEIGADANAYTSTDRTAYLFSCTEEFYTALEILVKMVITPVFTEANVKKEQGIIAQEIKMCEDRTSNILHYNLMKAMYKENPVRVPIAGTVDSIMQITPELLYKCYNAFYRMNNMALCICADAEMDKILEIVDRYLPEKEQEQVEFAECIEAPDVCSESIEASAQVSRPLFEIGIKTPEATAENEFCYDVLCEAVFGESEEFFASCFENELVSAYHYYFEYSRTSSYMEIGGDSDEPLEVFAELKKCAEKIRENGIDKGAFERAKRKLYAESLRKFNDSESIAEEMFEAFLVGQSFLDCAESYGAVTYEQVNALAKEVFDEKRFAISTVVPKE